jgi:hypothetical protein
MTTTNEVHLEEQLATLQEELAGVEARNRALWSRLVEAEHVKSSLTHFYVAIHSVHANLEREQVVSAIQEIVVNLIGSEEFALFERNDEGLSLATSFGIHPDMDLHLAQVEEIARRGSLYVRPSPGADAAGGPRACVPLKAGGQVTGVLVIYRLLAHKVGLEALDYELFDLLATHAGIALYASSLHVRFGRREAG